MDKRWYPLELLTGVMVIQFVSDEFSVLVEHFIQAMKIFINDEILTQLNNQSSQEMPERPPLGEFDLFIGSSSKMVGIAFEIVQILQELFGQRQI